MKPVNPISPCQRFDDDLKAYLDGELSIFRRHQIWSHLKHCPICNEELKLMQTIEKEFTAEEIAPLESDLRAKILQSAPTVESKPYKATTTRSAVVNAFCLGGIGVIAVLVVMPVFHRARENGRHASLKADFMERQIAEKERAPAASPGFSASASAPLDSVQPPLAGSQYVDPADRQRSYTRHIVPATGGWRNQSTQPARSVHKEGSVTVSVENAENAGSSVEALVKNAGGFVASNTLSTGVGGLRSATLDVRVPVANFETTVKKIGALGVVRAKSINGEDVTAKVAIADSRKATLSRDLAMAQARLRNLRKEYKPSTPEIYAARSEVRNLNLQAAAAKAELDTLRRFAALATLYVTLQDKTKTPAPASFSGSISETGREAWSSFLSSAKLPVQLLVWILAYSPLWLPALILWRKFGRKVVWGD